MKSLKDYAFVMLGFLLLPLFNFAADFQYSEATDDLSKLKAVQYFEQGREAFEMGHRSEATTYFNMALENDNQYAVAWLYYALTAETDAERIISLDKAVLYRDNAAEEEKLLIDIEQTYAENNTKKRFELTKQLAHMRPVNARALLLLAGEYQNKGDVMKFRDLAHEAILTEPESPLGYRALAASYLLNEPIDFSLAIKYMKQFVEMRPNEPWANVAMGDVLRASLQLVGAKEFYTKAIDIDAQNTAALSKRGYINSFLGIFNEARADFKKAYMLKNFEHDYSKPYTNMFSYLVGGMETQVDDAELIPGKKPKNSRMPMSKNSDNCYFCRTFISMNYGLFASPDQSLKACLCIRHELNRESKVPDETTMEANFAFVEGVRSIQSKDYQKAEQSAKKYADIITPDIRPAQNEVFNFLKGWIDFKQDKYSSALAYFKKSDTDNIFVIYNMGLIYDKLGRFEEAKEMFTEVSEFSFSNACQLQMAYIADEWLKQLTDANLAEN